MTTPATTTDIVYQDDDLVYVDPDTRTVVGRVEFQENGRPKALARPSPAAAVADDDEEAVASPPPARGKRRAPRKPRVRYYPWGTYRSMKRIFKVAGKVPETRGQATLDEILPRALNEPFWDSPATERVVGASEGEGY